MGVLNVTPDSFSDGGRYADREAAVVQSVFDRYVNDGCSIADLTRWLAGQGVPTATGKTRWDRTFKLIRGYPLK